MDIKILESKVIEKKWNCYMKMINFYVNLLSVATRVTLCQELSNPANIFAEKRR